MPLNRPKHRLHVEPAAHPGQWPLTIERAHYLRRVLRLGMGDKVVVFDGSGREWIAAIAQATAALLEAVEELPGRDTESLSVTLVQSLARGERMDLMLQKATELGVTRLQPVSSARTEVKLNSKRAQRRMQHWRAVVVHAAEQSGRTRVPDLLPFLPFQGWLEQVQEQDPAALQLILAPGATTTLGQLPKPRGEIVAAIGPEGGFTEEELNVASKAGFQTLQLGPRILRTETAGPAALAAMQTLWGDLA